MVPHDLPPLLSVPLDGSRPYFIAPPRCAGSVAAVCGRVRLGAGAVLGNHAVLRGDGPEVKAGEDFFLGERSCVHAQRETDGTVLGAGVSVGRHAVLRACSIGDRTVIEDRVVVLDGARIGAGSVIGRESVVPEGAQLAGGHLYQGQPAQAVRALDPGELLVMRGRVRNAPGSGGAEPPPARWPAGAAAVAGFVAPTARIEGRLDLDAQASVWFGVRVDGGSHGVHLAPHACLQDNCSAYAMSGPLRIGTGATVGHNSVLQDCGIGAHSLVGSASFVAAGTQLQERVLLLAGSSTLPHQLLESGWVWGGRPARALRRLEAQDLERIATAARHCHGAIQGVREGFAEAMSGYLSGPA